MPIDNRYLTEAEARKQICPFRCTGEGNCLGSYCMCWKWTGYKITSELTAQKIEHSSNPTFKTVIENKRIHIRGCCGVIYKEDEILETEEKE